VRQHRDTAHEHVPDAGGRAQRLGMGRLVGRVS